MTNVNDVPSLTHYHLENLVTFCLSVSRGKVGNERKTVISFALFGELGVVVMFSVIYHKRNRSIRAFIDQDNGVCFDSISDLIG